MLTRWDALKLVAILVTALLPAGCQSDSGGPGDSGRDGMLEDAVDGGSDAGGDPGVDAGADTGADQGDPDPGDSSSACDQFTPKQLGLFERVFVTGASNTPGCQKRDCNLDSLQGHHGYYALAVVRGFERVQECVEYTPVVSLNSMSGELSLALSVDVFFHDTHDTVDSLVTAIHEHMSEFRAGYPEVPYIIPNVPESMINGSGDPAAYNQAFAEYDDSDPYAWILDLDAAMGKVLAGKVTYNGQVLSPLDVLVDPVHLNELGHLLVAEWIILRLNEIFPGLDIEPYGDLVIAD